MILTKIDPADVPPGSRRRCTVCQGDPARRSFIDQRLKEGYGGMQIQRMIDAMPDKRDWHVKRETIARHCVGDLKWPMPLARKYKVTTKPQWVPPEKKNPVMTTTDLARIVRDEAVRRVQEQELEVTVKEGLTAQALLDRREEKMLDRELQVGLARMLSGAGTAPPGTVIDGDYRRLETPVRQIEEEREPVPRVEPHNGRREARD